MRRRALGENGLQVTEICIGTGTLGSMPEVYGYAVDEANAHDTVRAILDGPINFIDTARIYAAGESEKRIGKVLGERGGLPKGFVLSTKVDRDEATGRFDAAQVRQSFEESLEALGLDRVHLLHLHDPEYCRDLNEVTARGGALDELFKMKDEGLVDAVGLAMGRIDMMFPIVRAWPFDVILNHNRFTLLNRSANELYDHAAARGIAIMNAAPYASGVLAKGSTTAARMTYREVDQAELAPVRRLEAACLAHGVPLGAAALQFSLRDPRITTTVVGVSKPERISQTVEWAKAEISQEFWSALDQIPYLTDDPQIWAD